MSLACDAMSIDVCTQTPPAAANLYSVGRVAGDRGAARRILLLSDCYRPAVNGVVSSLVGLRQGLLEVHAHMLEETFEVFQEA